MTNESNWTMSDEARESLRHYLSAAIIFSDAKTDVRTRTLAAFDMWFGLALRATPVPDPDYIFEGKAIAAYKASGGKEIWTRLDSSECEKWRRVVNAVTTAKSSDMVRQAQNAGAGGE